MRRTWRSSLLVLAILATTTSPAVAEDTVLDSTVQTGLVTALDGTVVWVYGNTLMQRAPNGRIRAVEDAPEADYRSIDLGRTGSGALVLTYLRCSDYTGCKAYSDDLAGHRSSYKRLVPKSCRLTSAPARWRNRIAYGLACSKLKGAPDVRDPKRSGLFIREGASAPRRLRTLDTRARSGNYPPSLVDLRGTHVGAVVAEDDFSAYALRQTVTGAGWRQQGIVSNCPGPCDGVEDPSYEKAASLSVGDGGDLWTLVVVDQGSGRSGQISRLAASGCWRSESVAGAEALAVDAHLTFLSVQGVGMVSHVFAPGALACPSTS